jgi:hypothetical protein
VPLPFSRKAIVTALTAVVAVLSLAHLAAILVEFAAGDAEYFTQRHLGTIRYQFDLEGEGNFSTWYSSTTLLLCAVLLWLIAYSRRLTGDRWAGHWKLLSVVFVFASIDEVAMMHEALTDPLHDFLHTSGIFYYAWVIVALPVVLGLGLVSLRFLASLPRRLRIEFLAAGAIFLTGALGLEMVEGVIATHHGEATLPMFLVRWLEEVLEMSGVLFFASTLLRVSAEDQLAAAGAPEVRLS